MPTTPAERRLDFAKFFFEEALTTESPEIHEKMFGHFASGRHFGIAAPRGGAKTTIGSIEVIYRIVNNLTHHTIIVSDTFTQAGDIVENVKIELEANEWIIWLYGDLRTAYHWTTTSFTTANDIRVTARGSNMKVRGLKYRYWRPDFVLIDDLENDEMVENPERRAKLLNWLKKALLPALARNKRQVALVGTVLHTDSLLSNVLDGKPGFGGWNTHRYKAIEMDESGKEISFWPNLFPIEKLKAMRDDPLDPDYIGPIAFAQEMQNTPVDDSTRIFKRPWIYGSDDRPNTYSFTARQAAFEAEHEGTERQWWQEELKTIVTAVDPAISEDALADYFAIVTIGVDKAGEIWVLDIFQERIGDIDIQVAKILEDNNKWTPDRINIESVAYQAGLARAVQKQAAAMGKRAPVFQVKPDRSKYRRAVIHSANFAGNLVHVLTDNPFSESFIQQLLDFPKGEHDDMLDAYMHAAENTVQRRQTRVYKRKPGGL